MTRDELEDLASDRASEYMADHTDKGNCECTKLETANWNAGIERGFELGFYAAGVELAEPLQKENEKLNKDLTDLNKNLTDLKEFYEKEYFEIADRTADEKIKELEQYEEEITIDDTNSYDPNSWGNMHEEMFVPKEAVRCILKENYALVDHQKSQLKQAASIIEELLDCFGETIGDGIQRDFLRDSNFIDNAKKLLKEIKNKE